MKRTTLLIALSLGLVSNAFAADQKKWCAEVPNWAKGLKVPEAKVYEKDVNVSKVVDKDFVKSVWKKIDDKALTKDDLWVIIDARSKSDRTQIISKTVLLTSDYKDATKHEFNEDLLTKKIGKRLKKSVSKENKDLKSKLKFASIADINKQDVKVIVFCNGPTCHRSTFGVCELNRLGFKRDNINIFLEGFDGLKDAGLKFRQGNSDGTLTH